MLIFSRKVGEGIIIDDNIDINILSVKGNKVRVGIEAPLIIEILRKEAYKKLQRDIIKQQQKYHYSHNND